MKTEKMLCASCAVILLLSGCAAPAGKTSGKGGNDATGATAVRCAAMGLGGATIGAILSGSKGAVKGALAGLAACAVVEVVARQTRSAAEVDQEYKAANRNKLPAEPKLDTYSTVVTPAGVIKAGEAVTVRSDIRVVSGTSEPVREVKEVLVAYAPDGEEFKRGEKKVNTAAGSGEYVNSFKLTLPQGAPQGEYKLATHVYVNGKKLSTRENNVQLASLNDETVVALLDH